MNIYRVTNWAKFSPDNMLVIEAETLALAKARARKLVGRRGNTLTPETEWTFSKARRPLVIWSAYDLNGAD